LRDRDPARFERAAARWAARLVFEGRAMTLRDAQLVVASLSALRGAEIDAATQALALLCAQQGQQQAAEVLERWARERVDSA
jgi:hypothetical protein